MENTSHDIDLESELTCSICTEILFQPLTLLDCLHTFCGACLKSWFSFQYTTHVENLRSSTHDPYTCPSCRTSVRATKHDARCHTLLEMFLKTHPDKERSEEEKEEWSERYRPGDVVLQPLSEREEPSRNRRRREEDHRLVDEVRFLSLREAIGRHDPPTSASRARRRYAGASVSTPTMRSERSDNRDSMNFQTERSSSQDSHYDFATQVHDDPEETTREHDSGQVEHQSSLRSLLSSDSGGVAMQDEILRQIREEGLLEGIDIETLTPEQHEEIGYKIAEAYLRKHRNEDARNGLAVVDSPRSRLHERRSMSDRPAHGGAGIGRRSRSVSLVNGQGRHSRSSRRHNTADGRLAPDSERHRATSGSERRDPAALARLSRRSDASVNDIDDALQLRGSAESITGMGERNVSSYGARISVTSNTQPTIVVETSSSSSNQRQLSPPSLPAIVTTGPSTQGPSYEDGLMLDADLIPAPLSPHRASSPSPSDRANAFGSAARPISSQGPPLRTTSLIRYSEPNITCSHCNKTHIEYDLHYSCSICANGNWHICSDCHHSSSIPSCNFYFGPGNLAWSRWKSYVTTNNLSHDSERPHMLFANRYRPPKSSEGGAQGRRTVTTDNPEDRLESGCFCSNCSAWANDCYWRCDVCNDNEWGFCNNCVEAGKHCTHPLLPLTYIPPEIPASPLYRTLRIPISASILTDADIVPIGPFRPLSLISLCSICENVISPTMFRYHCSICVAPANEICQTCYDKLHSVRAISPENGLEGWHRCLEGHRTVLVKFEIDQKDRFQRRYVVQDLVGGNRLNMAACSTDQSLEQWEWTTGVGEKRLRYVTRDVSATATQSQAVFPPEGGCGKVLIAKWGWFPPRPATRNFDEDTTYEEDEGSRSDELVFPRGAELRECEDINGDWWYGVYMGRGGLFPTGYGSLVNT